MPTLLLVLLLFGDEFAIRRAVYARFLDRPVLVISHEPWGEARLDFPGVWQPPLVIHRVRHVADGEARVDATRGPQRLRIVLKKEDGVWTIYSVQVSALPPTVFQ